MEQGENGVPVVYLHDVRRRYKQGEATLTILDGASLALWEGQSVALVAPSGTGKSTLLHIAGLLEQADEGEVYVGGTATSGLSDVERTQIRRTDIGFVYQSHRLLPEFSALENVMMPQMIRGLPKKETIKRSQEILAYLGLAERVTHRPAELSGGEQQRVAIARAVANAPRVLLADEPTGNLDPHTADHVFNALTQLVRATRVAMLIATHNMDLAARMDRRVSLQDGHVIELDLAEPGRSVGRALCAAARLIDRLAVAVGVIGIGVAACIGAGRRRLTLLVSRVPAIAITGLDIATLEAERIVPGLRRGGLDGEAGAEHREGQK